MAAFLGTALTLAFDLPAGGQAAAAHPEKRAPGPSIVIATATGMFDGGLRFQRRPIRRLQPDGRVGVRAARRRWVISACKNGLRMWRARAEQSINQRR
jgi:hypothetical protein